MIIIEWENTKQKASGMRSLGRRIENIHVPTWGRDVGEKGQETIEEAVMDGGVNKTAKGGARIKTGAMFDSAGNLVVSGGGVANVTAGFINGPPEHTKWQERGTRGRRIDSKNPRLKPTKGRGSGIPAMLAVPLAVAAMRVEMDNAGRQMLAKIAAEWNSI